MSSSSTVPLWAVIAVPYLCCHHFASLLEEHRVVLGGHADDVIGNAVCFEVCPEVFCVRNCSDYNGAGLALGEGCREVFIWCSLPMEMFTPVSSNA